MASRGLCAAANFLETKRPTRILARLMCVPKGNSRNPGTNAHQRVVGVQVVQETLLPIFSPKIFNHLRSHAEQRLFGDNTARFRRQQAMINMP